MEIRGNKSLITANDIIRILTVIVTILMVTLLFKIYPSISMNKSTLNNFTTVLLSLILEGFPFIILGSFISSIIQVFISEETIARVIPKNKYIGILIAAFMGLVFPVCECAIIPIVRRLIKKGVPQAMAVTFMLSVPIINPIVLASTYYAFIGKPYMVFFRAILGVLTAIIIGCLMGTLYKGNPLKNNEPKGNVNFTHVIKKQKNLKGNVKYVSHKQERTILGSISQILHHTSFEVYNVGKLFIIGAFLSSIMQSFIPRNYILSIGGGQLSSILVMMTLAFVLSICSETDAFIARAFLGQFTTGSVLGFLILGPMLDIKNTIMLTGNFKIGFVIKLVFLIIIICFIMAVASNLFLVPILG